VLFSERAEKWNPPAPFTFRNVCVRESALREFARTGGITKMRWPVCFAFHESQITSHESRVKEGRRPRWSYDWVGWRPPDAILAFPLPAIAQEEGKSILFSAAGNSGHSGRITTPRSCS
jgi:hypothetical protein